MIEKHLPYQAHQPPHESDHASADYDANAEDPLDAILQGVNSADVDENSIEDLVDKHPLAQELMARLRVVRRAGIAGPKEDELVEGAQHMRAHIADDIKTRLGIQESSPEEKAEQDEQARLRAVSEIRSQIGPDESEESLVRKYGLVDEEGKMSLGSIGSPLFRADTKAAFNKYLKFATRFDAMQEAEAFSGSRVRNAPQASNMRREAHNRVASLVQRDFGLDFDSSRSIISKMRESVIPNSGESTRYAKLLRGQKIADKYGHDASAMTKAEIGSLLDDEN